MGGQHRWAPAYLAACHHIYIIIYYMYISLANKIVVVVVYSVYLTHLTARRGTLFGPGVKIHSFPSLLTSFLFPIFPSLPSLTSRTP